MANKSQNVDLDSTISALQQDPKSIPADQAIAMLEGWQQQLKGTELADLAEDLIELKKAITDGDEAAIASMLKDLGEDTAEVASDLPDEVAPQVKKLSTLLTNASKS
ncbi:MAG: hypothetical protein HC879_18180 [Leptolyngbyaceae cyanobacterium SL_5_9]|nr:hypothetical protein [Leptolyngbyaceae cyanobacterium SL_5_9]NJO75871.1 hypothetical protein [Leptolyngbyaceae cyanobacterium RM1_406_9]